MNFDEWWNDQQAGAPAMVFNTEEDMARAAWNTASRIEREECAKLREDRMKYFNRGAAEQYEAENCAAAIRSKA